MKESRPDKNEILEQIYVSADDLEILMPGMVYSQRLALIKEIRKEMEERKIYPESFQEALLDAKSEKNIMKDLDDNFTFIFNGRESVIRLDDIKYVGETDTTEIYTYKNHKGKTTTFEIIKAYPGLREEIKNTATVNHEFPFPKKYKEKISSNPWYVFLILMGLFVGLPILILLIKYFIG